MTDCPLIQLDNGKWHCPVCDPDKLRLLPVNAHRNCRPGQPPYRNQEPVLDSITKQNRPRRNARQQNTTGQKGPGSHLHDILVKLVGEGPTRRCNCTDRIIAMDRWGPERCRQHLDEIADWLLTEAKKRGWKSARWFGAKTAVKTLIRLAIRKAEKEIQMTEFTCQRCGNCCRTAVRLFPMLLPDEPAPEWMRMMEKHLHSLNTPKAAPCIFLTADNRCALQDVYKPQVCRDYQCKNLIKKAGRK